MGVPVVQFLPSLVGDEYPGWQEHVKFVVGENMPVQRVFVPHWDWHKVTGGNN